MFCSFAKKPGAEGGYTYSPDEIEERVREAVLKWPINEVHIVGGHHPELGLEYYLAMLRKIRAVSGSLYIKAFTAPEIDHIARLSSLTVREVLMRFKEAGLDGMPGGGAEIFAPAVRSKICRGKISADEWLAIHQTAHEIGIGTNATMLYGHIESDEDRVDHVLRLRELQDRTHGFHSFIPLAFQKENNRLKKLGETGGFMDLKVFAVSRLLLDNIAHLKAHWVGLGLKMAQVALSFGVDDLGGTNLNEKIFHDAGSEVPVDLSCDAMERMIRGAGYEPCLVDSSYTVKNSN
jgi:aminodeoxyfutalosine synthase